MRQPHETAHHRSPYRLLFCLLERPQVKFALYSQERAGLIGDDRDGTAGILRLHASCAEAVPSVQQADATPQPRPVAATPTTQLQQLCGHFTTFQSRRHRTLRRSRTPTPASLVRQQLRGLRGSGWRLRTRGRGISRLQLGGASSVTQLQKPGHQPRGDKVLGDAQATRARSVRPDTYRPFARKDAWVFRTVSSSVGMRSRYTDTEPARIIWNVLPLLPWRYTILPLALSKMPTYRHNS